jgi:AcrR family transcriptional regulator
MIPVEPPVRAYRSPRRAAATDKTRARIVAAARELLTDGDKQPAFSLDGVAKRAGVTRLTVYHQFASKRGLLEAVFDDVAREGGLVYDLPKLFAHTNIETALKDFVRVFCRFWAYRSGIMPKLASQMRNDKEIAESLTQRIERRRQVLATLVKRLLPELKDKVATDLIDVLFASTGFEMYEALSVRNRGAKAVEALMQRVVKQTLREFQ